MLFIMHLAGNNNGVLEIFIYLGALILGLVLNAMRNKNKQKPGRTEETKKKPVFPDIIFGPILDDIRSDYDEPELDTMPASEVPVEYKTPSVETGVPVDRIETGPVVKEELQPDIISEEGVSAFAYPEDHHIKDEISESFYESIVLTNIAGSESDITDIPGSEEEYLEFDVRKAIIYSEILKPKHSNTDY